MFKFPYYQKYWNYFHQILHSVKHQQALFAGCIKGAPQIKMADGRHFEKRDVSTAVWQILTKFGAVCT